MSGFNKNLPKEEKIQCLLCLSSLKPIEIEDGSVQCPECGATTKSFLQIIPEHQNIDLDISAQENTGT